MKSVFTPALTPALSPGRGRIIRRRARKPAPGFAGSPLAKSGTYARCPLSLGERVRVRASVHTGCRKVLTLLALVSLLCSVARAETVSIYIPTNAAPRVEFGAGKLAEALKAVKLDARFVRSGEIYPGPGIWLNRPRVQKTGKEGFSVGRNGKNDLAVESADDSGALYGCLELAKRIRAEGKLPLNANFSDKPAMTLRGTCIGMQKTYILPGRKVYEYPYTPELFPWFYDRKLWQEYLDFLVANRMNTLYLWNGHPFASLVRLKDYPDAVEVPEDVFQKNVEMFRWLTTECDKRGIWLVQMFYNIFLPKPLAEKHGVPTQLATPTPLASDYTRKSIAEFVKQYPNVGLMVCLGEALQGTENQIVWATNTILPGVLDGMKAAGLKEQPPVVIRTHAMNPEAIMPACFTVYSNLFTETKYNGESLTTYEPRGKGQATHRAMARLGPHLVNVHILSNLEPFRYGAPRFIKKCMQASRDRLGASGLHLYPLAYWNWPYSPDIVGGTANLAVDGGNLPPSDSARLVARQDGQVARSTQLLQWDRDWIWFEAWARYAWNPDVPEPEDRAYWIGRLADFYGCDTNVAGKILDAYNDAGEVAPMLIRRFGITEGNRQTLSLGMTLDQLVNPKKYGAITELWESQAPPGERLDEYVRKEWKREPHVGETPASVIAEALHYSSNAVASVASVASPLARNRTEFERLRNDTRSIQAMAGNYAAKVKAAERVLRYDYSKDGQDLEAAQEAMVESLGAFEKLTRLTEKTYRFANSMQTGHRKIPFPGAANGVGTNYHWVQVLPLYQKELADFRASVAELKKSGPQPAGSPSRGFDAPGEAGAPIAAWPAAKFTLLSTNAETYEVKTGAQPFADRKYTITQLAPELDGLTGIRFSHEAAKNGRYVPVEFEVAEPVRVLIGYFQNERDLWLQVPNLDVASHADERGGVDVLLRNAAVIEECPNVNVHAFRYEPGRHRLELIGKGSFVILGVVPQSARLEKRDAGKGVK
jgi:hypothetical protein